MSAVEIGWNHDLMIDNLKKFLYCQENNGIEKVIYFDSKEDFDYFISFIWGVNRSESARRFEGTIKENARVNNPTNIYNMHSEFPMGQYLGTPAYGYEVLYTPMSGTYEAEIETKRDNWDKIYISEPSDVELPIYAVLYYPDDSDQITLRFEKEFKPSYGKNRNRYWTWESVMRVCKLGMNFKVEVSVYDCELQEYLSSVKLHFESNGYHEYATIPKQSKNVKVNLLKGADWYLEIVNPTEDCGKKVYYLKDGIDKKITIKCGENKEAKYRLELSSNKGRKICSSHSAKKLLNYLENRVYNDDIHNDEINEYVFCFKDIKCDEMIYEGKVYSKKDSNGNICTNFRYDEIMEVINPDSRYQLEIFGKDKENKKEHTPRWNFLSGDIEFLISKLQQVMKNKVYLNQPLPFSIESSKENFEFYIKKFERNIIYRGGCMASADFSDIYFGRGNKVDFFDEDSKPISSETMIKSINKKL